MNKALVGIAASALLLYACDRGGQQEAPTVTDYQQRSTEALERAQEAQERAREQHQQALDAREDVTAAQKELQEAQRALEERRARAQQELQEAQQAQAAAREHTESAQREASQAQQRAIDLQQRQQQQFATSNNTASNTAKDDSETDRGSAGTPPPDSASVQGRVEASTSDALVVRTGDGARVTLSLSPEVPVIVDGRRASVQDVPEGAEVRASFQPSGSTGERQASRVEIRTR